ncbi:U-box domain-containing protein 21-like [Panicum virgatum]|uniref:U-box domain-containing protein n=1 Tax=Panicum virgatum TaxID=38727 RepID=A0A8T0T209_PANVG|nr:U-box domain-containing protein 21-like [Panicum virgatum]KAG2605181.1 hypothetical protein PVAP13_4NG098538 [Panicum virgatum]
MVLSMSRATRAASRLVPEIPLLRRGGKQQAPEEVAVPAHFVCPISLDLMRDPVTAPTGITYDRESVEGWLARGSARCPVTGRPLRLADLVPNYATRRMIQDWCVANRAERVPTPKVPLGDADAAEAVAAVSRAAGRGDVPACGAAAARARALGKESDRNRRCLAAAGAARALAAAFGRLAGERVEGAGAASGALGEILAAATVFFPLDDEARRCIASPASLKSLASVMTHGGELAARASAAIVLRELASSADGRTLEAVARTPGMCDALVRLVRSPVSAPATKAALVTAYYLASASDRAAARLAEVGAVPALVELLVDADKGTSEKALAALDGVLCADAGLAAARAHALAVPVLVKKMFRVSDMATEFAVSALWRLCRAGDAGAAACRAEALRVGAFQKLLLLLQVGCGGVTKERASELLKMLNGSRGSVECIETVDFKGLKRPF